MIRTIARLLSIAALSSIAASSIMAQAAVNETRDPNQKQDADFAKLYTIWTGEAKYGSPLVDHLPRVAGIPTPKDVLGYYIVSAGETHVLRRPAEILSRARQGIAAREDRNDRQVR